MSNDNNVVAIGGFNAADEGGGQDAYYVAASAGAMNAQNPVDESFAAFCTFYVRGDMFPLPGNVPTFTGHLWGTLQAGVSGWALELTVVNGQLVLSATLGTGEAATTPLTGLDDGTGNRTSLVERMIMAGLWFDGDALYLSVNGNIVTPGIDVVANVPGNLPARMGLPPAGLNPAKYVDIISCGYYTGAPFSDSSRLIGTFAGAAFRAARSAYGSGLILPDNGLDWTHRYWARSVVQGTSASGVTKNAIGTSITAPASAPAVLPDIGLSGPQDTVSGLVALNRVGDLFLPSQKNADWYHGAGVVATAPTPP